MTNVIYLNNNGIEIDFERSVLARLGVKDINLIQVDDGGRGLPMDHYVNEYHAEGVALSFEPATAEVLAKCSSLKIISVLAVGYDTVDVGAATSRGITVTNVPGYCDEEVALHAFAMALDLTRQVTFHDRLVRGGGWRPLTGYPMQRLSGKTFGLVYFGRIAARLAEMLKAFGLVPLVHAPTKSAEFLAEHGCRKAETLDELLESSDYVSLHCPLIPGVTEHLIGEDQLRRMKPDSFLINTARGGVIDESALVMALREGWIRAAAVDVVEDPTTTSELAELDNCIVTPHTAFLSEGSMNELRERTLLHLIQRLSRDYGGVPDDVVNPEVLRGSFG